LGRFGVARESDEGIARLVGEPPRRFGV